MKPDATEGSQGFAQICCFIGEHTAEAPTPEAQRSMVLLLAGLAERYAVNPAPGSMTTFVSRGSNRWPAGDLVTTSTIAGHRDMSMTTCPGDAAYPLVKQVFPVEVAAVLAARATPAPAPAGASAEGTATASPSPSDEAAAPSPPASTGSTGRDDVDAAGGDGVEGSTLALVAGGLVAASAAVGLIKHARPHSWAGREPGAVSAETSEHTPDSPRRAKGISGGTSA